MSSPRRDDRRRSNLVIGLCLGLGMIGLIVGGVWYRWAYRDTFPIPRIVDPGPQYPPIPIKLKRPTTNDAEKKKG